MKKLLIFLFFFSCADYHGTNTYEAEAVKELLLVEQLVPYFVESLIKVQISNAGSDKIINCVGNKGYIQKEYDGDKIDVTFHNCALEKDGAFINFYGNFSYYINNQNNSQYNLYFKNINGILVFKLKDEEQAYSCKLKDLEADVFLEYQTLLHYHFNYGTICSFDAKSRFYYNINY